MYYKRFLLTCYSLLRRDNFDVYWCDRGSFIIELIFVFYKLQFIYTFISSGMFFLFIFLSHTIVQCYITVRTRVYKLT